MSRVLRAAFIPVLLSLAFVQVDDEGWEEFRRPVQKFSIENIAGGKLNEKAFEGKIVVVDFWATWCGPCVQELPELAKFADSVKDRKDVAFFSFSVDDEKADVVSFFREHKAGFSVYMASSLADKMEVSIFPTKLIIDGRKRMRVRLRKEGVAEAGELTRQVQELLKTP